MNEMYTVWNKKKKKKNKCNESCVTGVIYLGVLVNKYYHWFYSLVPQSRNSFYCTETCTFGAVTHCTPVHCHQWPIKKRMLMTTNSCKLITVLLGSTWRCGRHRGVPISDCRSRAGGCGGRACAVNGGLQTQGSGAGHGRWGNSCGEARTSQGCWGLYFHLSHALFLKPHDK